MVDLSALLHHVCRNTRHAHCIAVQEVGPPDMLGLPL